MQSAFLSQTDSAIEARLRRCVLTDNGVLKEFGVEDANKSRYFVSVFNILPPTVRFLRRLLEAESRLPPCCTKREDLVLSSFCTPSLLKPKSNSSGDAALHLFNVHLKNTFKPSSLVNKAQLEYDDLVRVQRNIFARALCAYVGALCNCNDNCQSACRTFLQNELMPQVNVSTMVESVRKALQQSSFTIEFDDLIAAKRGKASPHLVTAWCSRTSLTEQQHVRVSARVGCVSFYCKLYPTQHL